MLLSTHLVALTLAMAPWMASAALFPKDSTVQVIDAKAFKKAMKANQTSMVAFVAPWCGHCQKMAPEYSRAALGLYPLIPAYAVDCDDNKNKRLCAEQGVKGFPTIKLFPRGGQVPAMDYDVGERTASGFFYWASRRVPNSNKKIYYVDDIMPWVEQNKEKNRILLLTKDKNLPLLWRVLANKYQGQLEFGSHRDRKGKSSVKMGLDAGGKKEAKVLVYPAGSTSHIRYQGITKLDSLSKFIDSVLDGTADLTIVNEKAAEEEFAPTEEELEIERKQEAQRIALAHGGFTDLIDFEKALKDGAGADYHDTNGFPGMMGVPPQYKKEKPATPSPSVTETASQTHEATPVPVKEAPAEAEAKPEVEDKVTEEEIEAAQDQVVFEAPKPSPPAEAQCDSAPEGVSSTAGSCNATPERPKDEL